MKIFCKIFGHKYIQNNWWDIETEQYTYKRFDFCIRCGEYENKKDYNIVSYDEYQNSGTKNIY